jgi:hypothetical protein
MDITHEDLEKYLSRIFTGVELVYIKNGSMDICVEFRSPNNAVMLRANLLFDKMYNKALSAGILSSEKLEKLMKRRNIFTEEDEEKIEKLKAQLEAQELLLAKTTVVKAKQDRLKGIIKNIKDEINEISFKKSSKMSMSAEAKADESKLLYLCWASAYDADTGDLLWPTYNDLLKETNLSFKDNVFLGFLKFNRGVDTRIIRYIARSNLWRIRYVTSLKTSEALFGVPTSEYTNDMLNLVYWSNYYQSIYEMLPEDRPSDLVIEDDEALDSYMQSYYDERNKEDAARRSKRRTQGKLSAFDKEEVIVTQSNELYEDIKYDKPREAQRIKDRTMIKKRAGSRR